MQFDEYLKEKKIDPEKFKNGQPDQYEAFISLFNQINPNSFTQQKLFLINQIRRRYQLREQVETRKASTVKSVKPKIKPQKPKTS